MQMRTKVAALGTATAVLFTAGIAMASWTADGSGSGSAQAATKQVLTLTSATTSAQLFPGGKGDIVVTITNPNPYSIAVSSVAPGAVASITSTNAACGGAVGTPTAVNTSDLTYRWPGDLALTNVVVAAGSTYTLTIANGLAMGNNAVDACSGVSFTVPVTAKAQSTATTGTPGATGSVTVA